MTLLELLLALLAVFGLLCLTWLGLGWLLRHREVMATFRCLGMRGPGSVFGLFREHLT